MNTQSTPWWIYVILLLSGVSTAVALYQTFKKERSEKTMQNEEIVSWVDWQGKPREIIVHRKVRET